LTDLERRVSKLNTFNILWDEEREKDDIGSTEVREGGFQWKINVGRKIWGGGSIFL
jgi:hypothetical protein